MRSVKWIKVVVEILGLAIIIGLSYQLGFYVREQQIPVPIEGVANLDSGKPGEADFSLFWDAWRVIQERYAGRDNLDYQNMVYGAIAGMVNSLGDPHTIFLKPEEAKMFLEDVSGVFEGVGMEIGIRDTQLQVIAPLENTPAQKAGLRSGDKILMISEESTQGMSIEEAVSKIRGPKGSEVVLTIIREGWDGPDDIVIVRDAIEIPSLKWELMDDNIAYVRIYHFSGKANAAFQAAGYEVLNSGADSIVLDLRDNPGGYLEVARNIAGWFLEKGQVVAIEDFGQDEEPKLYKAQGNAKFLYYPVVVLINKGSASGSEILAGALRDHRAIKLIGETSFGKGSVQELESLRNASNLKVTVANWLTPNGDFITDIGLEPDITVEMTLEDYDAGRDPQLDRAIEIIKELR